MVDLTPRQFAYMALGGGVITVLVTFMVSSTSPFGVLFTGIAALCFMFTLLIYKYGYWIMPFVTKGLRIVEVRDGGYEIPPSQEAVLKKVSGIYYASMFLLVKIYESTTDKSAEENVVFSEYFERAISAMKYVTKVCMMVYMKDVSKYKEKIETKRGEAQLRLAREREKAEPDVLRVDRYEREVAMWDKQLSKLAFGEKPMGAVCYVMTTATGVTADAAIAAARIQANELRITVANALGAEVSVLNGEEMKRCFEWEFMMPPTPRELEESMI
ncbi:MAG: hypothetical protein AB1468_02115 [Candidatus Micrarchaeota archaeon]